ncbi:unnamed protein product [Leptidea sinapis]|uniref:FLYWCH-type domain-containing protein n=1 Tax=Leptidea sinapis TaxID=189913 RepID=A0A5E4PZ24_9NEOP|nr:unnamed protein product [Leptidea sinapis]
MESVVNKYRWRCSTHNKKRCSAVIYTIYDDIVSKFVTSQRGNTLLSYDGYTFCRKINKNRMGSSGDKYRWSCSTHNMQYVRSQRGSTLILYDGYTFFRSIQHRKIERSLQKYRWRCSTHSGKATFVTSRRGHTLIMYDGFTFCKQVKRTKVELLLKKYRWPCSTHNNKGCNASIMTIDNEIININNTHNHKRRSICGGYRFTRRSYISKNTNKYRWRCSLNSRSQYCKANIHTIENKIVFFRNEHNHEPTITTTLVPGRQKEIHFIHTKRGIILLLMGQLYHRVKNYKNGSVLWRCASYKKETCTGKVTLHENYLASHSKHSRYIKSRFGNALIQYNGYTYSKKKYSSPNKQRWVCASHASRNCRAVLYVIDNIFVPRYEHKHPPKIYKSFGNTLIRYNGYTYRKKKYSCPNKERWVCASHASRNCRAVLFVIGDMLVPRYEHKHPPKNTQLHSKKGKDLVILFGYKFFLHRTELRTGYVRKRWTCTSHSSRKCSAFLVTVDDLMMANLCLRLTREATNCYVRGVTRTMLKRNAQFVYELNARGNKMLRSRGYTYHIQRKASRGGVDRIRWRCSTHSPRGCKAALTTLNDQIIRLHTEHNHGPVYK